MMVLTCSYDYHESVALSYHNGTTTPCLSLSVPVPLGILNPDKSTVLSPPVPPCRPLSLSGSDYEQRRSQVRVLPSALLIFLQTEVFVAVPRRFDRRFRRLTGVGTVV